MCQQLSLVLPQDPFWILGSLPGPKSGVRKHLVVVTDDDWSWSGTTGWCAHSFFFFFRFLILFSTNMGRRRPKRPLGDRERGLDCGLAGAPNSFFWFSNFLKKPTFFLKQDAAAVPNGCKRPNGDERRRTGWGSDIRVVRCAQNLSFSFSFFFLTYFLVLTSFLILTGAD
jgi:hypothetical protein